MEGVIQKSIIGYEIKWDDVFRNPDNNIILYNFIKRYKIKKQDFTCIGAYTSRVSRLINGNLRGNQTMSDEQMKFVTKLDSALNKIPSMDNTLLFRDEEYDDAIREFLKGKVIGDEIKFNYYMSTYQEEMRNPRNGLQVVIHTKKSFSNAKDISVLGKSSEKEALFLRNTKFEIVRIDSSNPMVVLEEV